MQITLKIIINDSLFTFNSSSKNAWSSMCVISVETSTMTPDFLVFLAEVNLYRMAWQVLEKICTWEHFGRERPSDYLFLNYR